MIDKNTWYKRHLLDFINGTMKLSLEEKGLSNPRLEEELGDVQ